MYAFIFIRHSLVINWLKLQKKSLMEFGKDTDFIGPIDMTGNGWLKVRNYTILENELWNKLDVVKCATEHISNHSL